MNSKDMSDCAHNLGETPLIPVSWGELIDKVTILEIKNKQIRQGGALENVRRELGHLQAAIEPALAVAGIADLKSQLRAVNTALWDIENRIREKEAGQEFDAEFVALARSVYMRNDERSALKRKVNERLNSGIVEEKSYPVREADRA